MLFMHKETGDLLEMLVISIDDERSYVHKETMAKAYPIGQFTFYGTGEISSCKMYELGELFEFIGVV